VYQLAADMGGMGFIHAAECEIMHNSVLINVHMTHAAASLGVPRYFYSSSACVYRDMQPGEPELHEDEAIPAHPTTSTAGRSSIPSASRWPTPAGTA